ncbi:MAG TPA: fused MFS/spermidine synthase [Anaerolineaceae bacterium]|nr:fused MFS/spermidine synthase [Anaerolineaceae bacterium]
MRTRIYFAIFGAGLVSLAIEVSASRLLSNYFGSSNLIWACVIGSILIYMTIGSILGGKWADRSPQLELFYRIITWGAFSTGLIPSIAKPVLRSASLAMDTLSIGPLILAFAAVLALFSVPMVLLSMTSPFAIRLLVDEARTSGNISGKVYAISTAGSFIGTFLPVLVLIPTVGTYKNFLILASFLWLVGFWGSCTTPLGFRKTLIKFGWMPLVIALSAWFGLQGTDKISTGLIYEKESEYNYIQVQQINGYNLLRLNEGQGIHSIYHPGTLAYGGTWQQVLVAPFFQDAPYSPQDLRSMAILGLAGGTSARQAVSVFPDVHIDGFEIDGTVIEVGYDYFGMDVPQLTVFAQDARLGLRAMHKEYQLISIDAYRPPYIPAHLTTLEFFQEVYDHLSADGTLVLNVARIGDDRRLVNALATTLGRVFPSVYISDVPDTFNTMLYATRSATSVQNLYNNYLFLDASGNFPALLRESMETAILNLQPLGASDLVFTDDRAPVENLVNTMLIDFYRAGGVETLR